MFAKYPPNVNAAITFLKLFNVKVTNNTVNEALQNHPDWPNLLCITDNFNKWNIPNATGKIETTEIDELPVPFIAYTYHSNNPLAIVKQIDNTTIHLYQSNYPVLDNVTREDFFNQWSGIYLIAEPNNQSGELNYNIKKRNYILNSFIYVAAITLFLLFQLFSINKIAIFSITTLAIYLQYIILLTGTIITTLLLGYEINKSNPLLQKVCKGIIKSNCNAILSGKQSRVFSWLSWSEAGFFYFSGSLLALIFVPNSINILGYLSMLILPYTVFSIYYQWRVAKQWCILCLSVQAVILLSAVNVIVNDFLHPITQLSFLHFIHVLFFIAMITSIWFALKPFILKLQKAKNIKREYLRIKFNNDIFETLLKKQKIITIPTNELGIEIGNPTATNTIIKVCNPYCQPCAKAHSKIEELLEQNKNLIVKIIFTTPNDDRHPAIKPVRHILAIAEEGNEAKTKQALNDWYLPETKNYEDFKKKYPINGETLKQGNKLEMIEKWCKEVGIIVTPTIFINGRQLPEVYDIEDLQYFLLE